MCENCSRENVMKAAVVKEFKQELSIENVTIPQVGKNDILVKIKACGVCHTDLHAAHGDWPVKPTLPLIPGHEGVGGNCRGRRGNYSSESGRPCWCALVIFCMWSM